MPPKVRHLTLDERQALGQAARLRALPSSHSGWLPSSNRPDPVALLQEQNVARDADLVPVRHGRMKASPFTFYRGAAKIMAADLAGSPTAGLNVQLCGDAHLSNFGVFGSPERQLVFDINDFDETLPGPFEYDVKRLAASLFVAARNNGFPKSEARAITKESVRSYRAAMTDFASMRTLDVWYAHLAEDQLTQMTQRALADVSAKAKSMKGKKGKAKEKELEKLRRRMAKQAAKAHGRDSLQALSKLAEVTDDGYRIVYVPPVIVPARELHDIYGATAEQLGDVILDQFHSYRGTLQADRRQLLERFHVVDWGRKVVGVGSVGTRSFIALLQGRDQDDPLFLQIKEATASVLEGPLPKSRFRQAGERVVRGQRLMQASSDIFLGWTRGVEADRFFYWRQLRDMKGSALVELMPTEALSFYGGICGWTLARAHARSGDPVAIASYLGADDEFDQAITDFSERYADQNDRDYEAFVDAIATQRIDATEGI